jgi:hypothetical protein
VKNIETLSQDTKLIVVPKEVADTIKIIAGRIGVPLPVYVTQALTQVIRADELDVSIKETIDLFELTTIQKDSGSIRIFRSDFEKIITELPIRKKKALQKIWYNSGNWYGNYLKTKLDLDSILNYFEKDLFISWNLDDVVFETKDVELVLKCISFDISKELMSLLIQYISGFMEALSFSETEKEILKGLVYIRYIKKQ